MDTTLFTPAMIETFRACPKAYQLAFLNPQNNTLASKASTLCKRFLLKAYAQVNNSNLITIQEAQKFIGQNWVTPKYSSVEQSKLIGAFRFAYKALVNYVSKPYKPAGSRTIVVNTKLRARIPHSRIYLEDVFDMILYYPKEEVLEIVDYHLNSLRPFDPAWPTPSLLIKHFLAQKLRSRLAFTKIRLTFIQILPNGLVTNSFDLDETVYQLHWAELTKTIMEIKNTTDFSLHSSETCKRCNFLAGSPGQVMSINTALSTNKPLPKSA